MNIQKTLFSLRDEKYGDFNSKLLPTLDRKTVIGVRTPALKTMAKEIAGTEEGEEFLATLPHRYFEENNLHAFLVERISDPERCLTEVEKFLPYVDNWATCDQMRPKAIAKDKRLLESKAFEWMASPHTYTVRYGILMLMCYFLDEHFSPEHLRNVAAVRSDEYYINMMCAWYFTTALAKQYNEVIPYLEKNLLSLWVHNKTIQKSIESYRITNEQKAYLKTLKRKAK